jgi:FkbM family methyltransferase
MIRPIRLLGRAIVKRLNRNHKAALLRFLAEELNIQGFAIVGANGTFVAPTYDRTIGATYLSTGAWDPGTLLLLETYLHAGGTLIDVGANIGLISVPTAGLDGVHVHAFEPYSENMRMLRANIELNSVQAHITAYELALSDNNDVMQLEISSNNSGDHRLRNQEYGSSLDAYQETSRRVSLVAVDSMDKVLTGVHLKSPVVMKIDVQGAEHLVLSGATGTLTGTAVLIIEFWPYGILRLGGDPILLLSKLCSEFPWLGLLEPERADGVIDFIPASSGIEVVLDRVSAQGPTGHVDLVFKRDA